MDPHSFIARAEAQRWLGIAEKLLMGHDFVGSKTFAIRARDSDPRLEAADQILAIADTLLAAEKPVVGNNGAQQADYYAILQLVRFAQDTDHIASQYRRLAVTLNPHQNRFPYSDQAFQLVNDAWAVLSNPMQKSIYDSELHLPRQQMQMNPIGFNLEQQQHHHHHHHQEQRNHQQQQQQQQHNFFSINHMGSGHEQESQQPFQTRVQQQQLLQQHNFLSQNPEQLFQHHREQEQQFQPPQVQPFRVTSPPHQQNPPPPPPPPPQPPQPQPPMQPPPPAAAPPQPPSSWSQPSPLSPQHLQEEQHHHQQQEQENAAPVQLPTTQDNGNNGAREEEEEEEEEEETEVETEEAAEDVDDSPTFWTACPYCFYMYEYPRVYAECTLHCDNCKRAFQAVRIRSPPPIIEGQEASFYCWGFFPLGVSMSHLQKNNGTGSRWTPFSRLHDVSRNVQHHLNGRAAPKKNFVVNKNSGPHIYIDDVTDDIFMGISDRSDSSDAEWNTTKKKKVKRTKKGAFKRRAQVIAVRVKDGRSGSNKDMENGGIADQKGLGVHTVPVAKTSKKSVGSNPRRQSGRVAKELGKLDLNVEFNNNEGEEPAQRVIVGNRGNGQGEEENIEGIGFFEGLDEFLSNMPILSVVNDEKVKAA